MQNNEIQLDPRCFYKNTINILTVSGGKDSTSILALASSFSNLNYISVFADTGHEHKLTYDYLEYLANTINVIFKVKADFSKDIERKRKYIEQHWFDKLISYGNSEQRAENIIRKALNILYPTGNPFLDMCLLKGRFPSTKARFCSQLLKHDVVKKQIIDPLLEEYEEVVLWQGVRKQESVQRAKLPIWEIDADNTPGLNIYRPILNWTHDEVFQYAKKQGIKPNPLYKMGMSRVGCMPCIHARKSELLKIFEQFESEIKRVEEWEKLVSQCSFRGCSTFFISTIDPLNREKKPDKITTETHGIRTVKEWALTTRGGRQFDLLTNLNEGSICNSVYAGVCE